MANTYKNIVITPNIGSAIDDPKIVFSGGNATVNTDITLRTYPTSNGTLSFEGSAGQLFSITNELTGTIFSVNDVSGIPSIEVLDTGLVKLAQYGGNILVGTGTDNATDKLQIVGGLSVVGGLRANTANITGNLFSGNITISGASNGITFVDGTRQTTAYNSGVDATQNTQIGGIQGVDVTQNTRLQSIETINTNQNTTISIIQGVDLGQNATITAVNQFAQAAFNQANTATTAGIDQYARDTANLSIGINATQNASISVIQGVDLGQNATITAVNQFAGSAFNTANGANGLAAGAFNTANGANGLAAGAYAQANVTIGVDTTQNTRLNSIETININQNTTISIIQGVDLGQNATITAVNQFAQSAYDKANTASSASIDQFARNTANGANGLANGAYNQANVTIGVDATQNTQIAGIQGVDIAQNSTIIAVNQFAQSAYDKANTASSASIDQFARNTANGANGLAGAAFNKANNALPLTGGTISGSLFIDNNLTVTGNLIVLGNTTSISANTLEVKDSLIKLAIGNYTSDALDIGFIGHYNAGTNAHTGLIRDVGTKEWYLFQGYTPELDGNNNIDITNSSFQTSNLNARFVKGNLIASTAVVNGVDVTSVFNTQNSTITAVNQFAQAAFNTANGANGLAAGAFNQANTTAGGLLTANSNISIIQGVDATQNTRLNAIETINTNQNTAISIIQGVDLGQNSTITAVNQFAQSAFNTANGANGLAAGAFNTANGANGLAAGAFNKANTGPTGFLANSVIFANATGFLSNTANIQFFTSNNTLYVANAISVGTFESEPSSIYVGSRVGFANNNISIVYQVYNANTNSLDTIFG